MLVWSCNLYVNFFILFLNFRILLYSTYFFSFKFFSASSLLMKQSIRLFEVRPSFFEIFFSFPAAVYALETYKIVQFSPIILSSLRVLGFPVCKSSRLGAFRYVGSSCPYPILQWYAGKVVLVVCQQISTHRPTVAVLVSNFTHWWWQWNCAPTAWALHRFHYFASFFFVY